MNKKVCIYTLYKHMYVGISTIRIYTQKIEKGKHKENICHICHAIG